MRNKCFLSVILPTYNRKYCISKMIDSVLGQSFGDFELIIVDDGSTDGTLDFLKEKYSDERIVIVQKENGGVSSARNLGISMAKGEFITFVDSDDYLLDGFFEDIFKVLQDHKGDVLVYGGWVLEGGKQYAVPLFYGDKTYGEDGVTCMDGNEFAKYFCINSGNSWGCAKIFRSDLIKKHNICFDPCVSYGEDMLFNLILYIFAPKVLTSPGKFYVYNNNANGLSRGMLKSKEKVENLILVYKGLSQYENLRPYFALICLRHMKRWIFINYCFLGKNAKTSIRSMYHDVPLNDCYLTEKVEVKLAKRNFACAFPICFCMNFAYSCLHKATFLHPIIKPFARWIKAKLR